MFFVYVEGLRGPVGQKWPELPVDAKGVVLPHLWKIELPEHQRDYKISTLEMIYPFGLEREQLR